MTEKQKMLAGELYGANDPELMADAERACDWLARYNAASTASPDHKRALLIEGRGDVGVDVTIRAPFHCDYGYNVRLGDGVFINFGCVILDVVSVQIGAGTQMGPGVQILTADHPRDAAARALMLEFGGRSRSVATSGLAEVPSYFLASRLVMMRSLGLEASSHEMLPPTSQSRAIPRAL